MREWTVMIYMAGDNDLDSNGLRDLLEMKRVGSTKEVAIVAEFDRSGPSLHTKRYVIRNFEESPHLRDDVVDDLKETISGSKTQFIDFLKWGMGFEAEKHLVIMWGHGAGVDDTDVYVTKSRVARLPRDRRRGIFRPKAPSAARRLVERFELDTSMDRFLSGLTDNVYTLVATDDPAEEFIDNVELKEALAAAGKKIDILGMDACLMSMAEICYQVRQNVDITVASQAQTAKEGWPYERFLRKLVSNPGMSPEELSSVLVREFVDFYRDHEGTSAALAACRLKASPNLASLIDRLAVTLTDNLSEISVMNAIMASRRLVWADEEIETVDLQDLCGLLRKHCNNASIDGACTNIINFLKVNGAFMIDFDKHGEDARFAHGLGIYFPQSSITPTYEALDFVSSSGSTGVASAPQWRAFIRKYIEATTR